MSKPPEFLFYQLDARPVEKVLPKLLERTLERGWRAVVRAESEERVQALDTALWTYDDAAFLPHAADGPDAPRQPILISVTGRNANQAQVLFLTDGGAFAGNEGFARVVFIFDGRNKAAKVQARALWREVKAKGSLVSYWRETAEGGWERAG